jgi:hypothetical protein
LKTRYIAPTLAFILCLVAESAATGHAFQTGAADRTSSPVPTAAVRDPDACCPRLALTALLGRQASSLSWSIPGSEIDYDDVIAAGAALRLHYRLARSEHGRIFVTAGARVSRIVDGRARDSDYRSSGEEFSRSVSSLSGEQSTGLSIVAGLGLPVERSVLGELRLAASWQRETQTVRMTGGRQIIPPDAPDLLEGLDSRYRSRWTAPGVDVGMTASYGRLRLDVTATLQPRTTYHGEGEWNLREDLRQPVSFVHHAKGHGHSIDAHLEIILGSRYAGLIAIGGARRTTSLGTDTLFPVVGGPGVSNLNPIDWRTRWVRLGISRSLP